MKKLFTLLLLCLLALTNKTNAQTPFSATYNFANVTTSSGTVDPTTPPSVAGVTFSPFVAEGFGNVNSGIPGFFYFNWGTNSSLPPTMYYEVTLTPSSGTVSLDKIAFDVLRNSNGPAAFAVRSDFNGDNFATNLTASVAPAGSGNITVLSGNTFTANPSSLFYLIGGFSQGSEIILSSFSFTAPVSFRFYAWDGTNGQLGIDNVEFTGSVSTTPPAPSRILFWTNETEDVDFNNPLNWREGSSSTYALNTPPGAMTTPTSAPSANDTICFDFGVVAHYVTITNSLIPVNPSQCGFPSGAVSVSGLLVSSNYGGELYANIFGTTLLLADTMVLNGNSGMIFYAPTNGTIEVTKGLSTISSPIINNNNTTLHLSGSGAQSIIGSGFSVSALKISGGGTKTLNAPITVLDNVDVSTATLNANGNLILPASLNLTARVAPITGGGTITGNAQVHAFVPGGGTGWDLLGTSGVNNQNIGTWNSGSINGQQFPMTCSDCVWTPSQAGGFTSIQEWDESTNDWLTNATTATPLTPGKGYWVYMSSGQYTTDPFDIQYSGTLAQGNVNVPVTKGTGLGWNLLANPYPSPISIADFLTANVVPNDIQGAISIWDASAGGGSGAWQTPNTGVIAAGQGFYVEANSAGTVLFTESMKSTANSTQLVSRQAAGDNLKGFDLTIQGFYGDGDKTRFDINPNASFGYDRYDFHKQFVTPNYMGYGPSATYSKYTSISSIIYKDTLAINALSPGFDKNVSIPILARGSGSGSYTISVQNLANFPNCLMLKDKVTGMFHDVKATPYIFTMSDTTSAARFELMVCRDEKPVVSVAELNADSHISIAHNGEAVLVNTYFEQTTKALISVYNIMGQKLINDQEVTGTHTSTRLNLDAHNQVLIIKVTTDKESLTKKVVVR
ncbi:MAG: T9SS type A sorting domain-containing protein [Bacteroidetes bacterium]|nr:T9SS type A sorting domain-containing protein [Bacteroidota bacterium]